MHCQGLFFFGKGWKLVAVNVMLFSQGCCPPVGGKIINRHSELDSASVCALHELRATAAE